MPAVDFVTDNLGPVTGPITTVSGLTAFWYLLPIAINAMSQPSIYGNKMLGSAQQFRGSLVPHRSSPLICLIDAGLEITSLLRLAWRHVCHVPTEQLYSWNKFVSKNSSVAYFLSKNPEYAHTITTLDQTERLHIFFRENPEIWSSILKMRTNRFPPIRVETVYNRDFDSKQRSIVVSMKLVLFIVGVLPQAITIFSMHGVPITQTLAAVFLFASTTHAVTTFFQQEVDEECDQLKHWLMKNVLGSIYTFTHREWLCFVHAVGYILLWYHVDAAVSLPDTISTQETAEAIRVIVAWINLACILGWFIALCILHSFPGLPRLSRAPGVIFWILAWGSGTLTRWSRYNGEAHVHRSFIKAQIPYALRWIVLYSEGVLAIGVVALLLSAIVVSAVANLVRRLWKDAEKAVSSHGGLHPTAGPTTISAGMQSQSNFFETTFEDQIELERLRQISESGQESERPTRLPEKTRSEWLDTAKGFAYATDVEDEGIKPTYWHIAIVADNMKKLFRNLKMLFMAPFSRTSTDGPSRSVGELLSDLLLTLLTLAIHTPLFWCMTVSDAIGTWYPIPVMIHILPRDETVRWMMFAVFNIFTVLGYYIAIFDSTNTSMPAWTAIFN